MNTNTRDWRLWAAIIGMAGCVQFVILTIIAMFFYPGGTHADHNTIGYSFWSNQFSDLGRTATFLGDSNTTSLILFTIALALAGITLIIFFAATPHLFASTKGIRHLSICGSVIGMISGVCFVGIAFISVDLYRLPHIVFVFAAFISFFLVALIYSVAIFRSKGYSNTFAFVYLCYAFILLARHVHILFVGPDIETLQGVKIMATGQKAIVYALIVCMFIQAHGAWKMLRKAS